MRLLLIHGAPATGKTTIAERLLEAVPGRLVNEQDIARTAYLVFDHDRQGFWDLHAGIREKIVETAAVHDAGLLVMIAGFSFPRDMASIEKYERIFQRYGGELLPVYLRCPQHELESRINGADRRKAGKITTIESLRSILSQPGLQPIPRQNCLSIDTSKVAPKDAVASIVTHFELDTPGKAPTPEQRAARLDHQATEDHSDIEFESNGTTFGP